jgi:hypothetical protein
MAKLFNMPKRLALSAFSLALVLTFCVAGVTGAARQAPQAGDTPIAVNPCTVVVTPLSQTAIVGQPIQINITPVCTNATTPPSYLQDYVLVAWGDGSVTTYNFCNTICPLDPSGVPTSAIPLPIRAIHTYTVTDDYHPTVCLIAPSTFIAPSCTAVEVKVLGVA